MTRLTVNGQPVHYKMAPETPLLWALRDASNLTGAKYGCGTGECGACTVHVDGKAMQACVITLAEAEGTFVTTIEGLGHDRNHPVQQAWIAENLPQCGFCQPGMVMAAAALLTKTKSPSDDEIASAITNICRCGTYPRIHAAIRRAARMANGGERIDAAPPANVSADDAADAVPALRAIDSKKLSER